MIRTHTNFPEVFPESWASGWGEDEYGLWMTFTYKKVTQQFRWMDPGTFVMGSPTEERERERDETLHKVSLTKGFWIADTTVTQALWEAVMGDNPSQGANRPVQSVSWEDAQTFIKKMNDLKPELELYLPTEAQWEYACRAGTTTPFYFGEQISSEVVNYNGNYPYANGGKGEYRKQTVDVTSLPPNDWGLYEMHGNVWEWCQDWFGEYPSEPVVDPKGAKGGVLRVLRGGSWIRFGRLCRSAYRSRGAPGFRDGDYGFRLARGH